MEKAPRFRRKPETIGNIRLQSRDLEIIKLAWDYRFLNSEQIQALVQGSEQVVLRRLQKLFHHGYLDRPLSQIVFSNPLFGPQKMVYSLGDKGADLLAEEYGIDRGEISWQEKNKEVKERYIQHTLMISDFRTCLTLSLKNTPETKLLFWQRDNPQKLRYHVQVRDGTQQKTLSIIPDGFFCVEDPESKMYFFLEADRSTMTNKRYLAKMRAYWAWYRHNGTKELGFDSFRILTITKTINRRDNLAKVTQRAFDDPGGHYMFWFASQEDFSLSNPSSTLGDIWVTANTKSEKSHSLLE